MGDDNRKVGTSGMFLDSSESDVDFTIKNSFQTGKYAVNDLEFLETISLNHIGRVRLVKSKKNEKFYSLKIMKKSMIASSNQFQHVLDEVQILSRLRCIFVPEMHAFFLDENSLYTLSDYVAGGELFSHLRRQEVFEPIIYQFYSTEIVCAIHYLHKRKILYRGLKPESVVISCDGHIRLVDFSFSKILDIQNRTHTLCGTPEYCAPEILEGLGYGFASDWWSLGILIYEMAYGFPCFYGESPFAVYRKILEGSIHFTSKKKVPQSTKNVVKKLLQKDRNKRLGAGSSCQLLLILCFVKNELYTIISIFKESSCAP